METKTYQNRIHLSEMKTMKLLVT